MISTVIFILTLMTVTLAAVADIYKRRIPNWLTAPAFFAGMAIHFFQSGWAGIFDSLLGFLIGFSIFFFLWLMGGKGAGDAKLIGAVGALLGYQQLLVAFVLIALVGGVMAALYIFKHNALYQAVSNIVQFPRHVKEQLSSRQFGRASGPLTLQSPTAIKFPYGVPIAIGTMLSFIVMK
ncbi:MAG: prepilin peptidase [Acidobacteria bacterium]|nr:prepilin peptidase [Acidobacteriota bacterium]MBI3657960.1 prepilin peptidase [Acidobacteriota bacterium]